MIWSATVLACHSGSWPACRQAAGFNPPPPSLPPQVLTKVGGLPADKLVALELLWTPEEAGDTYSRDELLLDYPTLIPLS